MKRYLPIFIIVLLSIFSSGCGSDSYPQPPDYVGVYKSVRSSNDKTVMVRITKDDGTLYEGFIETIPVKGTWGKPETDQLGLITNQFNKGYDMYFVDFYLSIGGNVVYAGTAYRQ